MTAWDNQKIRYVYDQTNGQPATGWAVAMALELYLDFIKPLYQPSSYLRKKRLIKERLSWGSCLGFFCLPTCAILIVTKE